jgi:transposase
MSHLIEGPGHSRHFAGMPNDFRSSGKVTASRSTRDALHVDLRGAAKRARDEAVVEGISTVWPSIATIRSEDFRPARAAGPLGTMLATRAPRAHPCAHGDHSACSSRISMTLATLQIRPPSGAANLHQRELAAVALKSSWSHRMLVRFFIVMDNYATHKTPKIKAWLARRPHYHVHFTPTSASWINQVERWFAELTRKQIQRGVHTSVRQLEADIRTFIDLHNRNPKPFKWTKSADQILASVKRFCHKAQQTLCGEL